MFSIVIPVYNKSDKIARCIDSVLNQSFAEFEVIIINDGSTDNSLAIINSFFDERIKIISTSNQGVVKARNFGLSICKNPLIAFIDADDYWLHNHLLILYQLNLDFPDAGFYTTKYSFHFSEEREVLPHFINIPDENWRGIVENYFESGMIYRLGCIDSIAVPKKVFDKLGGFDETIGNSPYGEDSKLWIKIAINYPVVYDTTLTAIYDLSGSNHLSKNEIKKRSYATFEEFEKHEKTDESLKIYLDLFRKEFAIKNKIAGNNETYKMYKKQISTKNLNWKINILFILPSFLLKILYSFKQYLENKNIIIDVHH